MKKKWEEKRKQHIEDDTFWSWTFLHLLIRNSVPRVEFELLGLQTTATENEIKKVYRILAFKYHSDTGSGERDKFVQATEAKNKCLAYEAKQSRRKPVVTSTPKGDNVYQGFNP